MDGEAIIYFFALPAMIYIFYIGGKFIQNWVELMTNISIKSKDENYDKDSD